ncbi:MAG: SIS domain-containing protein [bacterium]
MNTLEQIADQSGDFKEFAKGYFSHLSSLLEKLDVEPIAWLVEELKKARDNNNTIFIIGNGGSAATATHMVNDISTDVRRKSGNEKPFRVHSLTDNISVLTALGNDEGFANLFVSQLRIYYKPGDMLIAISASGNSPNVVKAAQWVKQNRGTVIGMVGFNGGLLKEISDILIHVQTPQGEFGPVEDVHLIIDHLVSTWLIYKGKKGE